MSVQSEIDRIAQNVANTYVALETLGCDMPTEQTSSNLSTTAGSAKVVLHKEQTLTEEQQEQARNNIGAASSDDTKNLLAQQEALITVLSDYEQMEYTVETGFYDTSHTIEPVANTNYSHVKCAVSEGDELKISTIVGLSSTLAMLLMYDADFNYIGLVNAGNENVTTEYIDEMYTVPSGVNYITVSSFGSAPTVKRKQLTGKNVLETISTFNKSVVARFKDNEFIVGFRYSDTKDMRIVFAPLGASDLMQIKSINLKTNISGKIDTDMDNNGTVFCQSYSDWVGPWKITANNNVDGDVDGVTFTGGWHGTSGNEGLPTARPLGLYAYVDNTQMADGVTYIGNCVKLHVINEIMGSNTVTTDGTGRGIIKDHIVYTITSDGNVHVEVTAEALESVWCMIYYGLQASYGNSYKNGILFVDNTNTMIWQDNTVPITGSAKSEKIIRNMIARSTDGDYLEMCLEDFGAGRFGLIPDTQTTAFTSATKMYNCMVLNQNFSLGTILIWRGGYKFYYIPDAD